MQGVSVNERPREVTHMNTCSEKSVALLIADTIRPCGDGSPCGRVSYEGPGSWLPRPIHPNSHGLFPLPFPASQPSSAPGRRGKHIDSRPDFGGCSSLKMLMRPEVIVGAARVDQGDRKSVV